MPLRLAPSQVDLEHCQLRYKGISLQPGWGAAAVKYDSDRLKNDARRKRVRVLTHFSRRVLRSVPLYPESALANQCIQEGQRTPGSVENQFQRIGERLTLWKDEFTIECELGLIRSDVDC
jgi:hypothetical protein